MCCKVQDQDGDREWTDDAGPGIRQRTPEKLGKWLFEARSHQQRPPGPFSGSCRLPGFGRGSPVPGLTQWEAVTGSEEEQSSMPRRTPRGR